MQGLKSTEIPRGVSVSKAGEHNCCKSSGSGLRYTFLVSGIDWCSLFAGSPSVLAGRPDFWTGPVSSQVGWVEVSLELLAWCSELILPWPLDCCASRWWKPHPSFTGLKKKAEMFSQKLGSESAETRKNSLLNLSYDKLRFRQLEIFMLIWDDR